MQVSVLMMVDSNANVVDKRFAYFDQRRNFYSWNLLENLCFTSRVHLLGFLRKLTIVLLVVTFWDLLTMF